MAILSSILVFYNRGDRIASIQQKIDELDFEAPKKGITDTIRIKPSISKKKL